VVDIALNMLAPTIFVLITYFSVGLNTEASSFFKHYFALILNVLTAASLGKKNKCFCIDCCHMQHYIFLQRFLPQAWHVLRSLWIARRRSHWQLY